MDPDNPENPETAENVEEPASQPAPVRPPVFFRVPHRYLVNPAGPNDDRFVLDILRNILVCIQRKDDTRRMRIYSAEPLPDYRELAEGALSYLTGAYPASVPDDGELLQPIEALPRFLRVLDIQPPNRQEFILATAGPRLYRPFVNEYGRMFNLDPVLTCCSGWESQDYNNEVGDIYAWYSSQPPLPQYF